MVVSSIRDNHDKDSYGKEKRRPPGHHTGVYELQRAELHD
jgi:hypothetical protein